MVFFYFCLIIFNFFPKSIVWSKEDCYRWSWWWGWWHWLEFIRFTWKSWYHLDHQTNPLKSTKNDILTSFLKFSRFFICFSFLIRLIDFSVCIKMKYFKINLNAEKKLSNEKTSLIIIHKIFSGTTTIINIRISTDEWLFIVTIYEYFFLFVASSSSLSSSSILNPNWFIWNFCFVKITSLKTLTYHYYNHQMLKYH